MDMPQQLPEAADALKAVAKELQTAEERLREASRAETNARNTRDSVKKRFEAAKKALDEAAARLTA